MIWRRRPADTLFAGAALALVLLAGASAAWAQVEPDGETSSNKSEARELAVQGASLLDECKYDAALEKLQRAEAMFHAPIHLLWIGEALDGQGRVHEAIQSYERLAAEELPDDAPLPFIKAKRTASERARELQARLPSLRINASEVMAEGMVVTVDGKPVEQLDATQQFDPGPHVVRAEAEGYAPFVRVVTLPNQSVEESVLIELEPVVTTASAPASGAEPPWLYGSGSRHVAITSMVAGGVFVIVGTATGIAAMNRVAELEETCVGVDCSGPAAALIGEAETLGNVSTASFVIGGAGLALGGVLLLLPDLLGPPDVGPPDDSPAAAGGVKIAPWSNGAASGVQVTF